MNDLEKAISQNRRLSELFAKRAELLTQRQELMDSIQSDLTDVDDEINAVQGGEVPETAKAEKTEKKRGPGRPPGSPNRAKVSAPKAEKAETKSKSKPRVSGGPKKMTMKNVIISVIKRHRNGVVLEGIVEGCHKAGYKSDSSPEGYVQNVRTNLNTLMNKGEVRKDRDSKKYYFVSQEEEAVQEPEREAA